MTAYKNLGGNSNVLSYELGEDSIHVVFKSGTHRNYLYNHVSPGKAIVERMKALAIQGHGLNSYISTTVKSNFAKKW
ncbi:hypothetical protein EST62_03275 [Chlorobaculum sp. 24CR]|uniref:hypothetical protein n=1 Tax=Chlorobaculum sp. 24CR TaxID=2508878 RepID=UPI00100A3A1F|nr:hypothetical protein [Chlorobaculum sp. 24CR]RXK88388.1 hypothetical protein EST62_03275 [Chlorobaculum sp. 24CR]